MATTTRRIAKTTTAGVLYTKPARRTNVRRHKVHTHLTELEKIQVATLMNMTQLPTKVVARMFNICEASAANHARKYREVTKGVIHSDRI
jgi:hypothetical protein